MRFLLTLAPCLALASLAATAHAAVPDSVGVERKGNRNLVLYRVEAGETLFGITRKYRTTVAEVQKLNPALAQGGVKVGQTLKVPALSNTAPSATAQKEKVPAGAGVEKVHVVTAGQTLFAIARQYKVSVSDLQTWNNLSSGSVYEGQQIVVSKPAGAAPAKAETSTVSEGPKPIPKKAESAAALTNKPEPVAPAAKPEPAPRPGYIRHQVRAGETLFAIARTYNADVEEIKRDNNLGTAGVQTGQSVEVKPGQPPVSTPATEAKPAAPLAEKVAQTRGTGDDTATASSTTNTALGFERVVEHGVAELVDNDAGSRNYFCLHRTAQVGKIVQIKNEMNGAVVYARVIGKLPDTGNNDKVSIKVSRKAYETLAPADKRFPVEISYPNN